MLLCSWRGVLLPYRPHICRVSSQNGAMGFQRASARTAVAEGRTPYIVFQDEYIKANAERAKKLRFAKLRLEISKAYRSLSEEEFRLLQERAKESEANPLPDYCKDEKELKRLARARRECLKLKKTLGQKYGVPKKPDLFQSYLSRCPSEPAFQLLAKTLRKTWDSLSEEERDPFREGYSKDYKSYEKKNESIRTILEDQAGYRAVLFPRLFNRTFQQEGEVEEEQRRALCMKKDALDFARRNKIIQLTEKLKVMRNKRQALYDARNSLLLKGDRLANELAAETRLLLSRKKEAEVTVSKLQKEIQKQEKLLLEKTNAKGKVVS